MLVPRQQNVKERSNYPVTQIATIYVSVASKFLVSLVILLLTILANRAVNSLFRTRLKDLTYVHTLRMLTRNTVLVLGSIAILLVWLGSGGSFTVAMGILGAGIAFAAQESIGSFAGYLNILSGRLFQIGDRIGMGNVEGDVLDISLLRTTLMEIGAWVQADQYTGRVVSVANRMVFSGPVSNYTQQWPYLWDEIVIPITYESNWRRVVEIMLAHGRQYSSSMLADAEAKWQELQRRYPALVPTSVEPSLYIVMTDNWIELTLRYVVEARHRRLVRAQLHQELLHHFEAAPDITIASSTFAIVEFPPLKAEIQQTQATQ
jgi:small-conductance mechanosensitive channel